jgi:ATP-binding cassette, subfamily C (CFTR/MRP), member 1
VISGVTPIFTICLLPMILFYVTEQRFFTVSEPCLELFCTNFHSESSYRELKRLDSINRSPLYALLGETIDGVSVIRAFGAETTLVNRLTNMFDLQQHAYFLTFSAQSWLAVRLELVGTCIVTFTCLSAVTERVVHGSDEAFAGLAGLAISYALSVTQSLNWSVRMASDMEANMVAVERIMEYTILPSEGAKEVPLDEDLKLAHWPKAGKIAFDDAQMRYRPELPLTLKGLDIRIPASSKIGVVGRTGAGKSSLMVALMRIVELSGGQITIDGVDISKVGLSKLRKSISVIPQDPCLFSGTIRDNLDPFSNFDDEELYKCLESVGLYTGIKTSGHSATQAKTRIDSLDDTVLQGGNNFSLGQRQLIVIARALLSKNQIVIMDEATASVGTSCCLGNNVIV